MNPVTVKRHLVLAKHHLQYLVSKTGSVSLIISHTLNNTASVKVTLAIPLCDHPKIHNVGQDLAPQLDLNLVVGTRAPVVMEIYTAIHTQGRC